MGKRTSKEKWERNVNKHRLIQDTASYGVDLQKQSTKPDVRILKQAWTTMMTWHLIRINQRKYIILNCNSNGAPLLYLKSKTIKSG